MTSTEQLADIVLRVREATRCLAEDEPQLQAIAFEKLLDHELSHTASNNGLRNGAAEQPDGSYATPEMRAGAVGRYFDIAPADAAVLFDLSANSPELSVDGRALSGSNAEAVREIALLVCGARTALGVDTGTRNIMEAVKRYDKTDEDFNRHLIEFDKISVYGKSRSANRLVRMRVVGMEAGRDLAQRLVSDGV